MDFGTSAEGFVDGELGIETLLESSENYLLAQIEAKFCAPKINRSNMGDMPESINKKAMDMEVSEN